MWLATDLAFWFAGILGVVWVIARRIAPPHAAWVAPLLKEVAILLALYGAWRWTGGQGGPEIDGAFDRARWIWRAERAMFLPNEVTLQQWTMHATWLVRFANIYYIVVHVFPVGIMFVWLYGWHRASFARWRNHLAFTSIVCQLIQFIPVAPPRMFPELGFIDTAARYGPLVYDAAGANTASQLAAMPSMHVAWAMVIGFATISVGTSRWRWLGPAHAFLTMFAVTVTAYHWLLDGIVALAVLLAGLGLERLIARRRPVTPDAVPAA